MKRLKARPGGRSGLTHQPVTLAVRHEREIARLELAAFRALDLEPAPARRHDVEHQAVRHRR